MNNEKKLIRLIKEEYTNKILSLFRENVHDIFEADLFDKEGNMLLSPGLKVRHKKSGYEYTVDHVEGKDENAVVFLRHPEVPRFKPPAADAPLVESDEADLDLDGDEDEMDRIKVDQVNLGKIMGNTSEDTPLSISGQDPLEIMKKQDKGSLLKITKKEYEKEYEVK